VTKTPASPPEPDRPPDRFAISPGLGPVPAIYVARSPGRAGVLGLGRRAIGWAARLARGWTAGLRQRVS
jgi:hypothetical protein